MVATWPRGALQFGVSIAGGKPVRPSWDRLTPFLEAIPEQEEAR